MAAKRAAQGSAGRSGKAPAPKASDKAKVAAAKAAPKLVKPPKAKSASEPSKKPSAAKAAPAKLSKKTSARVKAPAKASKATKRSVASLVGAGSLEVGDAAPEFSLPDQAGETVTSAQLAGAPYVLYFYPKDDTPGCTREACDFQREIKGFAAAGVRVIGVSPDSSERHARFRGKHELGFTLLSDAELTLARAYGVWVMKQNYGRQYMGIQRSTFLVGPDGRLQRVWRDVRVNGHVSQVLEATR